MKTCQAIRWKKSVSYLKSPANWKVENSHGLWRVHANLCWTPWPVAIGCHKVSKGHTLIFWLTVACPFEHYRDVLGLQIQKYFVVRERLNKRDKLTSWSLSVFLNFCNGLWVRILPSYGENLNNQEIEKVTGVRSVFKWVTQMAVVAGHESGPWWWSGGQHPCLLLRWSDFESSWLLKLFFLCSKRRK